MSAFSVSESIPLVQLKYSVSTFSSQPEANHVINRFASFITKCTGNHVFLKRFLFPFENFYCARYIFSCQLPVLRAHQKQFLHLNTGPHYKKESKEEDK